MSWDALAAVGALVAAIVAAWQLHRLRVDALDARAAEIASVSLSTLVKIRPAASDVRDGRADWIYHYTLHNPGRLPITNVEAVITYPCDVQLRGHDHKLRPVIRSIKVEAAVVPPRGSHEPRIRKLSVAQKDWPTLREASVRITFDTPDAGSHVTEWPPRPAKTSRALRRRLSKN